MDFRNQILSILSGVALISLTGLTTTVYGQQVVAPLSPTPAIAEQQASTSKPTDSTSAGPSTPSTSTGELRWGPINFRPHFSYRYLYGNGIQASPGNSKKTSINSFSPGLFAELGTHWTLDYTPTWTYYSSRVFRDTVDQAGQINWATKYQEWTLSAGQTYSRTDSPLVETGRQTQQSTYASNLNALFAFNSRFALETVLRQNLRFAEGFNDTREWSIRDMLHLQTSPFLDTAIGAEYGYTAVSKTADISALQILASATWRPINQLNMSLEAGLEKQHIYSEPSSNVQNPVYKASVQFIPVATTQLGLTASRSSSASYLDSQIMESTNYGISLSQRLLRRLLFNAALGHQESKYTSTRSSTSAGRKDKIDSANFSLNTTFRTRITTAVTYQYNRNSSNVTGFGFSSNQIGLEIGYSF